MGDCVKALQKSRKMTFIPILLSTDVVIDALWVHSQSFNREGIAEFWYFRAATWTAGVV